MKIYSKISKYNHSTRHGKTPKYIVIHYTGALGSAKNNAIYFSNGNRNASAHFFVDDVSIWQSVLLRNSAWHCGGGLQGSKGHKYHGICNNSNSIGIEMCCHIRNGNLYVSEETIKRTKTLVMFLMKKCNIPAKNVIRHYDVTGKVCPAPFCNTTAKDKKWTYRVKPYLTGKKQTT